MLSIAQAAAQMQGTTDVTSGNTMHERGYAVAAIVLSIAMTRAMWDSLV